MAHLYQATCECGYAIDGLMDGLCSDGVNWSVAQCLACSQIIAVSDGGAFDSCAQEQDLFVCPCCHSADIYLLSDFERNLNCPQCGKAALQIQPVMESA